MINYLFEFCGKNNKKQDATFHITLFVLRLCPASFFDTGFFIFSHKFHTLFEYHRVTDFHDE
jgi:hypothetical protein